MKAASKIFRIFVVGVIITLSSLLVFSPAVAETSNYNTYGCYNYNMYYEFDGTYYMYYVDISIATNDPTAHGTVSVSIFGNLDYNGAFTYYSHRVNGNRSTVFDGTRVGSGKGTFIQGANNISQVYKLDDTQYRAILSAIEDIDFTDVNIVNAINLMKSDIMSVLNDIDNLIDTISWVDINSTFNGFSNELNGTYTIPDTNGSLSPLYISFTNPNIIYDQSAIYKITVPYTIVKSRTGKMTLYVADQEVDADFYWYNNARKLEIYIYNIYSSSNLRNVKIKIESLAANKNVIYYPYSTYQFKVEMLTSNDIEYWTLLTYLEQNNVNDELGNENDNLSNSVDNYVQTEDNLIEGFDNAITENSVDPTQLPNSNPGNWGTGFTGSLGLIGHVFNMLTASATGGNAVYLLMNFSLMLGLALLIIGKRG